MQRLRQRTVSAEEALAVVESGNRVFIHGAAATPRTLVAELGRRLPALTDVETVSIHTNGPAPYAAPEAEGHARHRALFIGANVREAVNAGRADYVPIFLSDIPALFCNGALPIDVALLNISPPDEHGYCSLSTSIDIAKAAAETARCVIAQINVAMPRTLGDSFIHADRIDYAIMVDEPPFDEPPTTPTDDERRIGEHIAEMVENGSTLQLGIGAIPNAAAAALRDKRDLGVHTELFSDGIVNLVEAGVVTGACKDIHPRKIVSSFVVGSNKVYRFVHNNPGVELHPIDYTNDTSIIRRLKKMVTINSAIEVDLTGQVCADSIGDYFYSGVGGQMDFMRGAALSPGGKPIIALLSTAKRGTVSRLVPTLRPGAGVVTSRAHVHYVVTEHGVAYLHGRSIRERARSLIGIADPAFRDELREYAREHLGL
ncbi:MAG: acetyl-CoA hydrolase/transferase family protein [Chloroflexi bacterium]|nr:acetyl-CoA hydrolase/transferase family protein [Chloroflexota bacterium]